MNIQDTRIVEYKCKFCNHEWKVEYQSTMYPPAELNCPKCNKRGFHQRPYDFFKDGPK